MDPTVSVFMGRWVRLFKKNFIKYLRCAKGTMDTILYKTETISVCMELTNNLARITYYATSYTIS